MTTTPQYLKEHNETPQKPPGPKAGMWSLRYLDPMTGVRLRFNKTIRQLYSDFPGDLIGVDTAHFLPIDRDDAP